VSLLYAPAWSLRQQPSLRGGISRFARRRALAGAGRQRVRGRRRARVAYVTQPRHDRLCAEPAESGGPHAKWTVNAVVLP